MQNKQGSNNVRPLQRNKLEKKTYKFSNDLEAYQEELSLEQDYKLAELITGFNVSAIDDIKSMKVKDILKLLVKENVVEKFLEIVLIPKNSKTWAEDASCLQLHKSTTRGSRGQAGAALRMLKNSEVKQVIEDFFTLNPLLSGLSQILKPAQDSQTMSRMS